MKNEAWRLLAPVSDQGFVALDTSEDITNHEYPTLAGLAGLAMLVLMVQRCEFALFGNAL